MNERDVAAATAPAIREETEVCEMAAAADGDDAMVPNRHLKAMCQQFLDEVREVEEAGG